MKKINLTYILCSIGGYHQYIWIADTIDKNRFNLSFIFLDHTTDTLKSILQQKGFACYQLQIISKKDLLKGIFQVRKILKKEKTTIVHTHLVNASLVGLAAAKLAGIKKRIHTRHHANFHHDHFKKGVYLDNVINYLSTNIIVISKNVENIVRTKEKFHHNKISLIYHGIQLNEFEAANTNKIQLMKEKYKLNGFPIIGMVSRYEEGKGVQYAIEAFKQIITEHKQAILVIANAYGPEKASISKLLQQVPADNYIEIEYEKDIKTLYKCFDIFVHVPTDKEYEAFGQVYIEAMAAAVPVVCTLSGIACEYVNSNNASVVDYKNADDIARACNRFLKDDIYKQNIVLTAKNDVAKIFGFEKMMSELNALYLS